MNGRSERFAPNRRKPRCARGVAVEPSCHRWPFSPICAEIDIGTGEQVLTPGQVRRIEGPVLGPLGEVWLPYDRRAMHRVGQLLPQLRVNEIPRGNHAMHIDNAAAWSDAAAGEAFSLT
jgi:hypothetical protein